MSYGFFSKYDREVMRDFQIHEHHAKIVKLGRYVLQICLNINSTDHYLAAPKIKSELVLSYLHFNPTINSVLLTLKAAIMTAADNIYKYFFIVFQRK